MDPEAEETASPAEQAPRVSLHILQTIRTAQSQHGLRHGDYGRYRQYCTRRLRRLYRSTKFLHGHKRFAKKTLDPALVTDARCGHNCMPQRRRRPSVSACAGVHRVISGCPATCTAVPMCEFSF